MLKKKNCFSASLRKEVSHQDTKAQRKMRSIFLLRAFVY
jgi:hypothetical protein